MVVTLLAVAMVPLTVGAASASDSLQVGVTQSADTGNATVTVTRNDSAVENATVVVESSGNYTGNGTYATDANGTVELPNPDERVTVTLNVTEGNDTVTKTGDLVPLSDSLSVTAEADDANDTVTATVTQYGSVVGGATVAVNGTDYDNGTYETDGNGTVTVAEPANTTNLTFTATKGDLTAETTLEVQGDTLAVDVAQNDDNSVVVTVTEDGAPVENATVTVAGNYTDAGTYETDENGTVDLAAPLQTTTVDVTAEYDDETASTTATLQGDVAADDPFGQLVSHFVQRLKENGFDGPMGQFVSDFVTHNNPGKADEHAKGHGQADAEDHGKPDHAKNASAKDDDHGKSDHANGHDRADTNDDDSTDSTQTAETESDDGSEDGGSSDDSQGPPEHANGRGK